MLDKYGELAWDSLVFVDIQCKKKTLACSALKFHSRNSLPKLLGEQTMASYLILMFDCIYLLSIKTLYAEFINVNESEVLKI